MEHFTTQSLADRWDKTAVWITKQARKGNIPGAWKLGRQWRFHPDQIEAYEQGQRTDNIFALTTGSKRKQQYKKTA